MVIGELQNSKVKHLAFRQFCVWSNFKWKAAILWADVC